MFHALVAKILNPRKYLGPVVKDCQVVSDTPNYVDRVITIVPPTGGPETRMQERITWDESQGVVIFTTLNDPDKSGTVKNIVSEEPDGNVLVTFMFDLQWKEGADRDKAQKTIETFTRNGDNAVLGTIKAAEATYGGQ